MLGQYFDKRRALANGISFCGAGIGSFVLPPVIRHSVDTYGLDTTFLLLAACMFHVSIAGMLFRPAEFYVKLPEMVVWVTEISPETTIALSAETTMSASPIEAEYVSKKTMVPSTIDVMYVSESKQNCQVNGTVDNAVEKNFGFGWRLLCNPLLLMYAFTLSICDSSYGNVYMLMPPHATIIGFSETEGALLVSFLGISQTVSRLASGWFADCNIIDKKYIYQCALLVCGATFCVMPFLQSYVLLATASVICSLSAGSFVVLSAVLVAESLGTANLPTTYGILYSTESFFFLASPVLMGE